MNTIQGKNAVLSFLRDTYTPFVCTSNVSVSIETDLKPVRTTGDGTWKKYAYQSTGYTITLSGVMVNNQDADFTTWDVLNNQMLFLELPFRLSYFDDEAPSVVKTIQGTLLVKSTQLTANVGDVGKGDLNFNGTGSLLIFDGVVPCQTAVTAISTTGETDHDGNVTFHISSTGDVYNIAYQFDGAGDTVIQSDIDTIVQPGMNIGAHTIVVTPNCVNGFSGVPFSFNFTVTQGEFCDTRINDITIDQTAQTIKPVYAGGLAQTMGYKISNTLSEPAGMGTLVPITSTISFAALPASPFVYTVWITPYCSVNGSLLAGIGFSKRFTKSTQPAQSPISWNYVESAPGTNRGILSIYVNNVLTINKAVAGSGTFNVPKGASIRAVMTSNVLGQTAELNIIDSTTSAQVNFQLQPTPISLNYTFITNGDSYLIAGVV